MIVAGLSPLGAGLSPLVAELSPQLAWANCGMMTPGLATGHHSNKKETQTPLKASFQMILGFFFVGDPLGARTRDPILKRDVLYLLS